MRRSARQATRAANKARLSGAIIISDAPKNKKIAFADDDDDDDDGAAAAVDGGDDDNNLQVQHDGGSEDIHPADRAKDESGTNVDANGTANTENSDDDDDAVEEVTGSAARASTQQSRDVERKISKETASKKKRRKKSDIIVEENASKVENDDAENEDESVDEDEDEDEDEDDDDDDDDDDENDRKQENDYSFSINSRLTNYEQLQDLAPLLELALWKMKITERCDGNPINGDVKLACRIDSLALVNFIIQNVLSFLVDG